MNSYLKPVSKALQPDSPSMIQQPDWSQITSRHQLEQTQTTLIQQLGYDAGSLIYAPIGRLPNNTPGPVYALISTGLAENELIPNWSAQAEQNPLSHVISPTWRMTLSQTLPRQFDLRKMVQDSQQDYSIAEQNWLQSLIDQGFKELTVTPVHFADKRYFALSCLKRRDNPSPTAHFSSQTQAELLFCSHKLAQLCQDLGLVTGLSQNNLSLTPREQQCLHWSAQGKSAIETAEILGIKQETVRSYIKSLLKKLNADNKTQAVAIGYELGLLG